MGYPVFQWGIDAYVSKNNSFTPDHLEKHAHRETDISHSDRVRLQYTYCTLQYNTHIGLKEKKCNYTMDFSSVSQATIGTSGTILRMLAGSVDWRCLTCFWKPDSYLNIQICRD